MTRDQRIVFVLASLFICAYFLLFAGAGFQAYFHFDDLRNLYWAWTTPVEDLLKANLLFFSPSYRPLGGLFYRFTFSIVGFNPLPFRMLCFAILIANLYLLYLFLRRLTDSYEIAALAALIACYQARFVDLYYSTGTICDLLCFLFLFLAFYYYSRVRLDGRYLSLRQLLAFCLIYICALNSKEMAVTLPFLVLIFEALYSPPATLRFRCLGQWLFQEARVFWPAVLITLVFARGKLSEPSVFAQHSAYTPLVSWKRYFETSSHYLDQLFYRIEWFDVTKTVLFWLVLFTIAWVTRNVHLKFGALFLFVSILPLSFIPPRSAFVLYIPMFGWALYGAAVLAMTRNYVFERLSRRLKAGWRAYGRFAGSGKLPVGPSQVALFLGVALLLAPAHAFPHHILFSLTILRRYNSL